MKFCEIPWTFVFRFFAEKLNFAKFRGLPYSVFSRNSVFCSVFRFYAEKIKFRGILQNSAKFRIPFFGGLPYFVPYSVFTRKKLNSAEFCEIPRNFAEFRIPLFPYSMFHIYFVFFRGIPQKNTKQDQRNSGEFRAEFFKNFDGILFPYGTKFGFPVQHYSLILLIFTPCSRKLYFLIKE